MNKLMIGIVAASIVFSLPAVEKRKGPEALSHMLQGTQEADSITLDDVKDVYVVTGEYLVPIGKTLIVKEGVTVSFNKGAGFLVQGSLSVDGVTNAPAIFKGKASGIGYWAGIKIDKSDTSDISCASIQGAKVAIQFSNCKAAVRKTLIFRNDIGVGCSEADATIEDCAIVQNRSDGINIGRAHPHIDHCYVGQNGGYAVGGNYYASATMVSSVFTKNKKGGVYLWLWDCVVSANQCAFINNKKFEVEIGTNLSWDFTENYWGEGMTKFLNASGCNVKLPRIKDKRHGDTKLGLVDVSKHLTAMPADCGPRECIHVKGIY